MRGEVGERRDCASLLSDAVAQLARARYPSLCVRTLSPTDLAPLPHQPRPRRDRCRALRLPRRLLRRPQPLPPRQPRCRAALHDCAFLLSVAAAQLARTEVELRRLCPDRLRWQLDNAQTLGQLHSMSTSFFSSSVASR